MSQDLNNSNISLSDKEIKVHLPTGTVILPCIDLPLHLASWLAQGRLDVYRRLQEDPDRVDFFQQHLPVLVTQNRGSFFPSNCGNKGVGFLPRTEYLTQYIKLYQDAIAATQGSPWQDSLAARISAARSFHEDKGAIDSRCLTSIEIFQKQTFHNLRQQPLASLLFTGTSPEYKSFQLNCVVEIIDQDDPRFTFIKLSRRLFEFDAFHIAQPDFQYGYLFWISEVLDKTPHRVAERPSCAAMPEHAPPLDWDEDALSILNTLPAWSRVHIKMQIEHYGLERGFTKITADVLTEAKKALRQ